MVRLVGLVLLVSSIAFAEPVVVDVTFNDFPYDYRPPEPLGIDSPPAVAQGSIFKVWGRGLGPLDGALTPTANLPFVLAGVEVSIESSDGVVRSLPLYWVGIAQINTVMLSDVPVGRALLRVSYDGGTSAAFPVKIVRARPRLFDWVDNQGPGLVAKLPIVQVAEADGTRRLVTRAAPAKPGDLLVAWAYGLGPRFSAGDESAGAERLEAPVEVFLGDRSVEPQWAGRSGCCAAVDQVQFEVPADAAPDCETPLTLRLWGGVFSEPERLPITADGTSCEQLPTPGAPVDLGSIDFFRSERSGTPRDSFSARFLPESMLVGGGAQPGTCGGVIPVIRFAERPFDAGTLTVSTPVETFTVEPEVGRYRRDSSSAFLGPGSYSVTGGGADVGPFTATIEAPQTPEVDAASLPESLAPGDDLTVSWSGETPVRSVSIQSRTSFSYGDDSSQTSGGRFGQVGAVCFPGPGAQSFTFPRWLLRVMDWAPAEGDLGINSRVRNRVDVSVNSFVDESFEAEGIAVGRVSYSHSRIVDIPFAGPLLPVTPVATPSGEVVLAELAVSVFERSRGLAGRIRLDGGRGMLIEQDPARPPSFPVSPITVDLVWLDAAGVVVQVDVITGCRTACEPLAGPTEARWALALHPGDAARRGFRRGASANW